VDLERRMSIIAIVERGWIARLQIASAQGIQGQKLINVIAVTKLQQLSEAIENCDKSLCLRAKIQQV
jgi:hypothetical protein